MTSYGLEQQKDDGSKDRQIGFSQEETEKLLSGEVPEEILDGILQTSGVTSGVYAEEADSPTDAEPCGHILMCDYDDDVSFPSGFDGETREERVLSETRERLEETGSPVAVVLKSSPGSYHVWDLGVTALGEALLEALERHGDPMHAAVSKRRRKFVLRGSAKRYTETGEVYKEAPEVTHVLVRKESRLPASLPHIRYLASLADRQGEEQKAELLRAARDGVRTVGDGETLEVSRYLTVTDDLKREVW